LGEPQPATIELDTSLEVSYLDIGMDREQGDASLADITNRMSVKVGNLVSSPRAKLANRFHDPLGCLTGKEVSRNWHDTSLIRPAKEAVVAPR
jgi:hypothetical protein